MLSLINKDRIVNEFMELVRIDSLTYNERKMADKLKLKLNEMGLEVIEDNAGELIGGNAGNLICTFKGTKISTGDKKVSPILLMAHMDTVTPGLGKKPVIVGDLIKSDGTTILGGDDLAGVSSILEAIRVVIENDIEHGDIEIVFSVAEEGGLWGAKNLDYSKITSKFGFVFDSGGEIGSVAVIAPSQNRIKVVVYGKAAHAGIEPEQGISAIQIAASAISKMKLGRIDAETTANVGIINGGQATNIITDRVEIEAEARSRSELKLQQQTEHMKECFKHAAAAFGGSVDFEVDMMYPAFNIKENDKIIDFLKKASKEIGVELILEATGGGSDTNVLNGKGIQAVDMGIGMQKVHCVEEQIHIEDLIKSAEFIVAIIKNIE